MKTRLFMTTLIGGIALSVSGLAAPPATDFKALMRKTLDAWETLDPANAAPFYAQEADNVYFDVAPLRYNGWAEYAAGVSTNYPDLASVKFTLSDVSIHPHGNLAWATADLHFDMKTKSGAAKSLDGRWTLIWEKRGRGWLIVHEHVSVPLASPPSTVGQSLYQRLGGYDALAAVADNFIPRLVKDPQLGKYFVGHSTDSLHRIRQLMVEQLCGATGGPCFYLGRSMKTAHAGMGITDDEWDVAVDHFIEAMMQLKVPDKERDEMLTVVASLKKDIVISAGQ
ncbi:MAG TPA: nuclear transport factor 2 family protein [Terriglobia bacterium]|nr:nuclear transport factor 2 family protein [Terriglobia bacterium]